MTSLKPSLDGSVVRQVASLARLSFADHEWEAYSQDLIKIIDSFKDLENFTLSQEQGPQSLEAINPSLDNAPWEQAEASPENTLKTQTLIDQAPDKEGIFVRVPSVLDRIT